MRAKKYVLNDTMREILVESFEARGFKVEFRDDSVAVSKDGKTEIISNETVMQFIKAFGGPTD